MGELIAGLKPFESHMLEILGDEFEAQQDSDSSTDWAMSSAGAATVPNIPPDSTDSSDT
jgi:hypothetical protein